MEDLSDSKDLNNTLLITSNAIFNEICNAFPALDGITLDDDTFNTWRNAIPKHLEKSIEKGDRQHRLIRINIYQYLPIPTSSLFPFLISKCMKKLYLFSIQKSIFYFDALGTQRHFLN